MTSKFIIITSINPMTEAMARFAAMEDWTTVVVGDRKSEKIPSRGNLIFLSANDQLALGMKFVGHCPFNHYCRKNIGYLFAIRNGATVIYDTDDDNIPYDYWYEPEFSADATITCDRQFLNIYEQFSDSEVWPRGYPLDEIKAEAAVSRIPRQARVGVWQGLADLDPDVDAIYRLLNKGAVRFRRGPGFAINKGVFSPFNSQNTFWSKPAFVALYLPMTVRFRFTDILRGYVAQRIMWERDLALGVLEATVYQERNTHDLMRDFEDEIDCYTRIKNVTELLMATDLSGNGPGDIVSLYERLAAGGILAEDEVRHVSAWANEYVRVS